MLIKIAIVVSLCSQVNMANVLKKKAEIEKAIPNSQVSIRLDKKCVQPVQTFQ